MQLGACNYINPYHLFHIYNLYNMNYLKISKFKIFQRHQLPKCQRLVSTRNLDINALQYIWIRKICSRILFLFQWVSRWLPVIKNCNY